MTGHSSRTHAIAVGPKIISTDPCIAVGPGGELTEIIMRAISEVVDAGTSVSGAVCCQTAELTPGALNQHQLQTNLTSASIIIL